MDQPSVERRPISDFRLWRVLDAVCNEPEYSECDADERMSLRDYLVLCRDYLHAVSHFNETLLGDDVALLPREREWINKVQPVLDRVLPTIGEEDESNQ
jgi:hypothetical protein